MRSNKHSLKKYWVMVRETAIADFRRKDQGTLLGFLWTLLHPLVYFLVLYGLFKNWMGSSIPDFPLYLIIGIVQWNFFSAGTVAAIAAIAAKGTFIKNMNFPREVFVLSAVLSTVISHLFELLVLVAVWLILGRDVTLHVLGLLPLTLLTLYLVTAVGFILATIGVFFLDISRIWGILMNIGLFLTPVFYSLDQLTKDKRLLILANPMTHIIVATRSLMIDGKIPSFWALGYVLLVSTVIFAAGYRFFRMNEGYFAEKI